LRRELPAEQDRRLEAPAPWSEEIRDLLDGAVMLVARRTSLLAKRRFIYPPKINLQIKKLHS